MRAAQGNVLRVWIRVREGREEDEAKARRATEGLLLPLTTQQKLETGVQRTRRARACRAATADSGREVSGGQKLSVSFSVCVWVSPYVMAPGGGCVRLS